MVLGGWVGRYTSTLGRYMGAVGILAMYLGGTRGG
jgi:hypothetical protein